ncbi:PKD domain-containing protein [Ruixingdingia sedimenti]|uniref:PKD domain-containing protein n=1 Tax=Ruixingdingia sedimenti TaxID=3073604 RepID=A0ABU1F691_9RHOB|nr:PKD domain-containing protein [Xinfangfangia sp. LG-4]MDR5651954.1 PKD domain-containing protein [Xinfangfangia sp. LG-4]
MAFSSIVRWLLMVITVSFIAACKSDTPTAGADSTIIEIAGRSTVSAGTPLALTVTGNDGADTYDWVFSDGQTKAGADVNVTFPAAGVYTVLVKAMKGTEVLAETTGAISVFDAAAGANPGFVGIPVMFGDVGQDGVLELDDLLLAAQAAAGLYDTEFEAFEAADMNLSGTLDNADIGLIAQALLHDAPLPSAILDPWARPAGTVSMVSPALLDPDAEVAVLVDGVASPQVFRSILGYATFVVPKSLVGADAEVDVVLQVAGAEADRMPLLLKAPVAKPADAKADVLAFLDELADMIERQRTATQTFAEQSGGVDPADLKIVMGGAEAGGVQFAEAVEGVRELLNGPDGAQLAQFLQAVFYANGLDEFRADVATIQTEGTLPMRRLGVEAPADVCAIYVPAVCMLKSTVSAISTGSNILAGACSTAALVALVGGAVIPADGPAIEVAALAGFVKFCLPLTVPLQVAGIVGDLVKPLDFDFRLSSDKTSLDDGETATITAEVTFIGLNNLCGLGVTKGAKELINKKLGARIVGMLMTKSTTYKLLGEIYAKIGEDSYTGLLTAIQNVVSNTLDATGLSDAFENFINKVCGFIPPTGGVVADAKDFNLTATNGGLLSFLPDGKATLACPAPGSGGGSGAITVSGSRVLCGSDTKSASVDVSCGTGNVTITMGDNGSANDDIYEVIIDGRTVLTSSVPVRSVSVTVQLPKGQTTVLMRGRAAPDGIGTYFISFSGATVISGQTSGSDLTPGVTKTFIIEVQ